MNKFFPDIQKNFGFGMMRLPMVGEDVDLEHTAKMVDAFMEAGFNYFDTAHPYIKGKSETAIRDCLVKRYPRESYILTNKLSGFCFEKEEEIRPLFADQLEKCGVEYFDFYLHHAMGAERHKKHLDTNAYEIVKEFKAQGKVRHIGLSFHDSAEVLDMILSERPEIEVVQLQINYADWEDPNVQGHACYDVCVKHNKPVIVMEPVKGGSLVNLPQKAMDLMGGRPASYAVRFAADHDQIMMVLSGMSNMEQMEDNILTMKDFQPLNDAEMEIIDQVRTIFQGMHKIPCTGCRYCVEGCPAGIPIPDVFTAFNNKKREKEGADEAYAAFENNASACLGCGQCEAECPQHLHIRELMEAVAKAF